MAPSGVEFEGFRPQLGSADLGTDGASCEFCILHFCDWNGVHLTTECGHHAAGACGANRASAGRSAVDRSACVQTRITRFSLSRHWRNGGRIPKSKIYQCGCSDYGASTMNIATPHIASLSKNNIPISSRAINRSSGLRLEIRERLSDDESAFRETIRNLLSPRQQELLLHEARVFTYRRGGETLFSEGQDTSFVYFIVSGIIRTSRYAENGARQILSFKVSGDFLGLPQNGRHTNSAETVGPAKVCRISWQRIQQIVLIEPALQLHLLLKIADDCRRAEQRIATLGQQSICQRLASFILDLQKLPDFFDEKRSLLRIPVNRFDLADYLGTVTKSSQRSFAKLENGGFIRRITSRTIEILDVDGLQRLQREQRHSHP